jgi:predicted dehydrogenase
MYRIALIHDQTLDGAAENALAAIGKPEAIAALEGVATQDSNARSYTGVDDLLQEEKGLEKLWVHARTGYHAEYIIKALQAGKDVVCNTPLCLTASAAWQIVETAKYTGRKIWVLNGPCLFWEQLRQEAGEVRRFHAWARVEASDKGNTFPDGGPLHGALYGFAEALATVLGPIESIEGQLQGASSETTEDAGQVSVQLLAGGSGHIDWTVTPEAGTTPGFSIRVEGTRSVIEVSGDIINGRLQLANVEAAGMPDPGQGPGLPAQVASAFGGQDVPSLDPFKALRVVELIDRIYSRLRPSDR